jgi:hypothetical protein
MKKSLLLSLFVLLVSGISFSQSNNDCTLTNLKAGGGYNYQIIGEVSEQMVDTLFVNLPETKRKGYVWKFKNINIPGIDESLTFQVHQGIAGSEQNGRGYFNTFESEKYKTERLARKTENEKPAIIIYVKHGRNHVLKTPEEAKIVKEYLLSLFEA